MEPLRNEEPVTNSANPGLRRDAAGQNQERLLPKPEVVPHPDAPKSEAPKAPTMTPPKVVNVEPLTKEEKQQMLYSGGIIGALVLAVIALIVSISANRNRGLDESALIDGFAKALAQNPPAQVQAAPNSANAGNAGATTQPPNSASGANSQYQGSGVGITNPRAVNSGGGGTDANGNAVNNSSANLNTNNSGMNANPGGSGNQ
jgi:hypothetical protein